MSRSTVNWTGPYVGVEMGAAASVTRLNASAGGATASTTEGGQSVLGGAFGGFDYQVSDRFVIGALGEIAVANPQSTLSVSAGGAGTMVNVSPSFSWSAMGRLGWLASPSTLLYAVGGYTGEAVNINATAFGGGGSAGFSSYNMLSGWTAGPGVEARIADRWSTKLEYRYSEYGTQTVLPGITAALHAHDPPRPRLQVPHSFAMTSIPGVAASLARGGAQLQAEPRSTARCRARCAARCSATAQAATSLPANGSPTGSTATA